MDDTVFPATVLPLAGKLEAEPAPLDKRIIGERNRSEVLYWLARFGWLTSRMIAALVWSDAAQAQAMARRTLKVLVDEKLVIARTLGKGVVAYLLSASGARLVQEQRGIEAKSGNSLAIGNPIHRACSNWYLIRAVSRGFSIVTEHEIATDRGPCRVLNGKQADGLIHSDGQCIWLECEQAHKGRGERYKTVSLVQESIGGMKQVELGPDLWLSRVAVVAANEQGLRLMAASFQDAHRRGLLRDSQIADVEACLLPVSESLVPGEVVEGNLWWDVLVPALQ